jgi:Kef-type K+ transport system membrane component KefB
MTHAVQGHFADTGLLLICVLAGALFIRLRQPVPIARLVVCNLAGPAARAGVQAYDLGDRLAQALHSQEAPV